MKISFDDVEPITWSRVFSLYCRLCDDDRRKLLPTPPERHERNKVMFPWVYRRIFKPGVQVGDIQLKIHINKPDNWDDLESKLKEKLTQEFYDAQAKAIAKRLQEQTRTAMLYGGEFNRTARKRNLNWTDDPTKETPLVTEVRLERLKYGAITKLQRTLLADPKAEAYVDAATDQVILRVSGCVLADKEHQFVYTTPANAVEHAKETAYERIRGVLSRLQTHPVANLPFVHKAALWAGRRFGAFRRAHPVCMKEHRIKARNIYPELTKRLPSESSVVVMAEPLNGHMERVPQPYRYPKWNQGPTDPEYSAYSRLYRAHRRESDEE